MVLCASSPQNKPDYNEIWYYECYYDGEDEDQIVHEKEIKLFKDKKEDDQETEILIEHMKILLKEKEDSTDLKYLELHWFETPDSEPKVQRLHTFLNCEQVVQSEKEFLNNETGLHEIEIQIFMQNECFMLIKDFKISYKKEDKTFKPIMEMIGCKYFLSMGYLDKESLKIKSRDNGLDEIETYIERNDILEELVICKPQHVNYKFEAYGVRSTFYFYSKEDCRRYLCIDIAFSDDTDKHEL